MLRCALQITPPAVKAAGGAGVPKLAGPELSQVVVHAETVKFASMFLCGGTAIGAVVTMLGIFAPTPSSSVPRFVPRSATLTLTAVI